MNIRQYGSSLFIRAILAIVIGSSPVYCFDTSSHAAYIHLNVKSARFWQDSAFAVVTVRSWRIAKRSHGLRIADARVLSVLAAEHPIPLNIKIWMYYLPFDVGPISPGGTYVVFMQKDRLGRWYMSGDVGTAILPRGANSWPVKGISDPLITSVRARIKKLAAAAGSHPRSWKFPEPAPRTQPGPRAVSIAKNKVWNSLWLPWGHDYTTETGSSFRQKFWASNAVVVLRVDRLLPQRYVASYYPPMGSLISARVVLVCATDLPVPTKIKLTCIWAKGIVGRVLPPLASIKPGAMFLARISAPVHRYGRTKADAVRNWLIQPDRLVTFMPGRMSLVPISGLNDPKLHQTEIKVTAARKKYWKEWAKNQLPRP